MVYRIKLQLEVTAELGIVIYVELVLQSQCTNVRKRWTQYLRKLLRPGNMWKVSPTYMVARKHKKKQKMQDQNSK